MFDPLSNNSAVKKYVVVFGAIFKTCQCTMERRLDGFERFLRKCFSRHRFSQNDDIWHYVPTNSKLAHPPPPPGHLKLSLARGGGNLTDRNVLGVGYLTTTPEGVGKFIRCLDFMFPVFPAALRIKTARVCLQMLKQLPDPSVYH